MGLGLGGWGNRLKPARGGTSRTKRGLYSLNVLNRNIHYQKIAVLSGGKPEKRNWRLAEKVSQMRLTRAKGD